MRWRIVKVDQTSMVDAAWLDEMGVQECGVFYVYDADRHVHICSFTPSQELWPVASYALPGSGMADTDATSQILGDLELELLNSEETCCYVNVADMRRWPSESIDLMIDPRDDGEEDEAYYLRVCESLREYYQGNQPWF